MKENPKTENHAIKKEYDWFFVISIIAFVAVLFCDVFFLARNIRLHPNADLSSEMLLAKLLRDEHKWFTSNWYYSTELRVIAIAPIYSLFFYITNNWNVVRILGSVLMYILFSASIYYFCSRLFKDGRRIAPICGAIMLLPFSFEWRYMLLTGLYYAPQVAASFLEIGLLLDIISMPSEKKKKRIVFLAITLFIAFLSGLGGPRMIIMQFAPLLMCGICMIKKHFFFFLCTVFNFVSVCAGLVVNLILQASGKFVFMTYSHISPQFFSLFYIRKILVDLLKNYGAKGGFKDVQSILGCLFAFLLWGVFLVGIVFVIIKGISAIIKKTDDKKNKAKNEEDTGLPIVILYTVFQLLVFLMLYLFSNMDYQPRYNIHILAFIIPISCAILGKRCRYALLFPAIVAVLLCINNYSSFTKPDNNYVVYSALSDYLAQNNIKEGYASFWNGNLLTEMTNGNIEVWILESDANRRSLTVGDTIFPNDGQDIIPAEWLQIKSHRNIFPKGAYFVIATDNEYERYIHNKDIYDEHYVMSQGNLRLYIFE